MLAELRGIRATVCAERSVVEREIGDLAAEIRLRVRALLERDVRLAAEGSAIDYALAQIGEVADAPVWFDSEAAIARIQDALGGAVAEAVGSLADDVERIAGTKRARALELLAEIGG